MRIIAGTARSRQIEAPKGWDTRPTLDRVRENLFNIIAADVPEAEVLDLFAGSGALALEALSRGATSAVLVDRDRAAHLCEQKNAQTLGMADRADILLCDWRDALRRLKASGRHFSLIFLDPPYAMGDLRDVTAALLPLCAPDTLLVTEHQAGHPYMVDERWRKCDERHWGYAGVTMYRLQGEQMEEAQRG